MGVHVKESTIKRLLEGVREAKQQLSCKGREEVRWHSLFGWLSGSVRKDMMDLDWSKPDSDLACEIFARARVHRKEGQLARRTK